MFHFTHSFVPIQAISLPENLAMDRQELLYYLAGATIFCVVGILTGYFIWRRSHLQFAEIRRQNKQATEELNEFQNEIALEKKMLGDSGAENIPEEDSTKKEKKRKKKRKKKKAVESVAEKISDETSPVALVENPVAKAMRVDSPESDILPVGPVKTHKKKRKETDDDLFF